MSKSLKQRALRLNREYVCPNRIDTFAMAGIDLVIGERMGYCLYDLDGREYLDFHLNGGVFNLGHCNEELIEVFLGVIEILDIGNHHFPSLVRGELAEALARCAPKGLHYSVFSASGGEAVDIAIKSARRFTKRRKIVAATQGYHGRTGISGAIGDSSTAAAFFSDAPPGDAMTVPFNDLDAMETALKDGDAAAVILETMPATDGFPLPAPGYLPGVKELCERHGTLYIADEVQTGLGRTGRLWGVSAFGVLPDIMVIGKGLSGGYYPIAATMLSKEVGQWLHEDGWGHVSTFGGAELGCVIAKKVLEITQRPDTTEFIFRNATLFKNGLGDLQNRHPFLAEVRQKGVVIGLKCAHPEGGALLMKQLYDRGLWAIFAGFDHSVLQFKPGLLLSEEAVAKSLNILDDALSACEAMTGG